MPSLSDILGFVTCWLAFLHLPLGVFATPVLVLTLQGWSLARV